MRVTTPIADMDITIDRLAVNGTRLVMQNAQDDAMPTRAEMTPQDVRTLFGHLLRPRVLFFGIRCLLGLVQNKGSSADTANIDHPTPHPW